MSESNQVGPRAMRQMRREKSLGVAIVLWATLGLLGVHRFYLGFWGSGLVRLFTLNFLGLGWLFDAFRVVDLYHMRMGDEPVGLFFNP